MKTRVEAFLPTKISIVRMDHIEGQISNDKYRRNLDGRNLHPGAAEPMHTFYDALTNTDIAYWSEGEGITDEYFSNESPINITNGYKSKRYADLSITFNQETLYFQVGVMNRNGTPVSREKYALIDISQEGYTVYYIPYRRK